MNEQLAGIQAIPWFLPETGAREKELVFEVLDSGYINDGDVTRLFESKVAQTIGVKHCVAVTSGTAAIALALMGLGIGCGDEVLVPDFTFIATANAVRLAGADVKLVDVEPSRFSLDIPRVIHAMSDRTRAIVAVDVNGRGVEYDSLEDISRSRGLSLISDAAEGFGSKWKGRFLGTFGEAGCFSFSANKTVTTGQGGMIATNNTDLFHRLLELKDQGRRFQGTGGNDLHPVMGFNFKLTNLQAAVGLAQLERLNERLQRARQRDDWYRNILKDCPAVTQPPAETLQGEVLQWTDILCTERNRLEAVLQQGGIGCRPFWLPLHSQKPYAADARDFPNATRISTQGLWLPSSFNLTREQAQFASEVIVNALSGGSD
jgi:perosamine synthetase